jgi:hypothetical protein
MWRLSAFADVESNSGAIGESDVNPALVESQPSQERGSTQGAAAHCIHEESLVLAMLMAITALAQHISCPMLAIRAGAFDIHQS